MTDIHYRCPDVWTDGAYGSVTLGSKGSTDYEFVGNTQICLDLEKLKIGQFASFGDWHWSRRRIVKLRRNEKTWSFIAEYEDGEVCEIREFLDEDDGRIFMRYIAKANRIRYYDNEIVVKRRSWQRDENLGIINSVIYTSVANEAYAQLKAYYGTFEALLEKNREGHLTQETKNYWEFRDGLTLLVSYHPNQNMKFRPYFYKKGDARVKPKAVRFV